VEWGPPCRDVRPPQPAPCGPHGPVPAVHIYMVSPSTRRDGGAPSLPQKAARATPSFLFRMRCRPPRCQRGEATPPTHRRGLPHRPGGHPPLPATTHRPPSPKPPRPAAPVTVPRRRAPPPPRGRRCAPRPRRRRSPTPAGARPTGDARCRTTPTARASARCRGGAGSVAGAGGRAPRRRPRHAGEGGWGAPTRRPWRGRAAAGVCLVPTAGGKPAGRAPLPSSGRCPPRQRRRRGRSAAARGARTTATAAAVPPRGPPRRFHREKNLQAGREEIPFRVSSLHKA